MEDTNRIPLKTDDDMLLWTDFVQTECGTLRELTVTITLHEYRDLIRECAEADEMNGQLHEQLADLRNRLEEAERKLSLAEFCRKEAEKKLAAATGDANA